MVCHLKLRDEPFNDQKYERFSENSNINIILQITQKLQMQLSHQIIELC